VAERRNAVDAAIHDSAQRKERACRECRLLFHSELPHQPKDGSCRLLSCFPKCALFAEWRSIRNKLKNEFETKRNEIAHFMLYQKASVRPSDRLPPTNEEIYREIDWYLAPNALNGAGRRKHPNGLPSITADELMKRGDAFIKVSEELWAFSEKVRALRA
jgi:hypothetical protein